MKYSVLRAGVAGLLLGALASSTAYARQSPSPHIIQSTVTLSFKVDSMGGILPRSFDYSLTHLGTVLFQATIPLTLSHHSLNAANAIYNADEIAACNAVTSAYATPDGVPIQVSREIFYHNPPSAPVRVSKNITDCP